MTGLEPLNGNVIPFPTSHARIAARRIGATSADIDAIAAEIEAIVAEIHRIIASDNAQRNQIMQDWKP